MLKAGILSGRANSYPDIMSKAADLHACVQNRIFCECPHGADRRHDIMPVFVDCDSQKMN